MVDEGITATFVRMVLDEESGELVLSIHTGMGEAMTFAVSGGKGWMLQGGIFSKLEKVLPGPLRKIYDAPVRIPREAIPGFMKNELPMLEKLMTVETNVFPDMLSLSPAKPRFRLGVEGTQSVLSATLHAEYGIVQLIAGRDDALGHFSIPSENDLLDFQVRNPDAEKEALSRRRYAAPPAARLADRPRRHGGTLHGTGRIHRTGCAHQSLRQFGFFRSRLRIRNP
jgi:hypothetical protein